MKRVKHPSIFPVSHLKEPTLCPLMKDALDLKGIYRESCVGWIHETHEPRMRRSATKTRNKPTLTTDPKWGCLNQRADRMQPAAAALTACAAWCFYGSLIDSLAALVSSSWSLHPLPSLCTQVERSSRGSRTWSQSSASTYATQISVFPFLCPSPEGDWVTVRRWGKRGEMQRWLDGARMSQSKHINLNAGHLLAAGLFLPQIPHTSVTLYFCNCWIGWVRFKRNFTIFSCNPESDKFMLYLHLCLFMQFKSTV